MIANSLNIFNTILLQVKLSLLGLLYKSSDKPNLSNIISLIHLIFKDQK